MNGNPLTATRVNRLVTYGLLFSAIIILVAGRLGALQGGGWTVAGLILFGLSCFTDPLLPGSTELTPQQVAMIRHIGLPYRQGAEKVVSMLVGTCFLASGLYLSLG
ncbi:hypothetical protein [Sphingosinicella rhizophila]|uniref:Uncharacterized protein n=1 Tax=Sphingosinicella rhizophila TaxID=3050082 RepID=A0ABU3Q363_9SPHN|nr:hypothetical protein [Sphingosinicella sp. GR2756]MDT9597418.1 hypothetical protein [Sphingosinicella sp. GR2756]